MAQHLAKSYREQALKTRERGIWIETRKGWGKSHDRKAVRERVAELLAEAERLENG